MSLEDHKPCWCGTCMCIPQRHKKIRGSILSAREIITVLVFTAVAWALGLAYGATVAEAQSRLMIVPMVGDGTRDNPNRPAHVREFNCAHSSIDHPYLRLYVAAINCVDPANTAIVAQQPDVIPYPTILDANLSELNVANWAGALEFLKIPAQELSTADTFRVMARKIVGMFFYAQRLQVVDTAGTVDLAAVELDSRFNSISPTGRTAMQATMDSLGFNGDVARNPTLRTILTEYSRQWATATFELNDLDL